MCQIKNDAMAMIKHTADAATAPFFLSFSPTNRVAVKYKVKGGNAVYGKQNEFLGRFQQKVASKE